jgi:hypothetical protein
MWTYAQRTGELWHDGLLVARGYAGFDDGDGLVEAGEGKNDPSAQDQVGVGPLPVGRYTIGHPMQHPTAGAYTMRLEPHAGNDMHGRAGFLIHGDRADLPGAASHGCIVLSRAVRTIIAESLDYELEVVPDLPPRSQENVA